MFDPKDMVKFFIARNIEGNIPDASQIVVAWKEGDTVGTQLTPDKLIGKIITGYEFVETNTGKTLFLHVK